MNLNKFLKDNHLRQVDLANYLGVSSTAISNVKRGISNFSDENLTKIIENQFNWDLSALNNDTEPEGMLHFKYKLEGMDLKKRGNSQADWVNAYERLITSLEDECKVLNKRIDELTTIIKNLSTK